MICNYCKNKDDQYNILVDRDCIMTITDNVFDKDFVQVFIIKLNSGDNPTQVFVRTDKCLKVIFKNILDGFYTICKLTIPTYESRPYYYKDGKYYHDGEEVSLLELIDVNPKISLILFDYIYYFSTVNLRKAYIDACLKIFSSRGSICNKDGLDSSLTYKRDLLWSALNVIKYLTEFDQFDEAERLLEEITGCNGLYSLNKCCRCQ